MIKEILELMFILHVTIIMVATSTLRMKLAPSLSTHVDESPKQ